MNERIKRQNSIYAIHTRLALFSTCSARKTLIIYEHEVKIESFEGMPEGLMFYRRKLGEGYRSSPNLNKSKSRLIILKDIVFFGLEVITEGVRLILFMIMLFLGWGLSAMSMDNVPVRN